MLSFLKLVFTFFIGVILGVVGVFLLSKDKDFFAKEDLSAKDCTPNDDVVENKMFFLDKIAKNVGNSNLIFNLGKVSIDEVKLSRAMKSSFKFYSFSSSCVIDIDVFADFSEVQFGQSYMTNIAASDTSSNVARIECSKALVENILPMIFSGAFPSILESKIYKNGIILETLPDSTENQMLTENFIVESLKGEITLVPNKFQIRVTDCSVVKC